MCMLNLQMWFKSLSSPGMVRRRPRAAISPDHRAQIEPVDHLDHKTRQMTRAMEMHVLAECKPHVAFGLVGAEIVEDEVDFALRKSGGFMKSRDSARRRLL